MQTHRGTAVRALTCPGEKSTEDEGHEDEALDDGSLDDEAPDDGSLDDEAPEVEAHEDGALMKPMETKQWKTRP